MSQSRKSQLDWLQKAIDKTGLSLNALAELARINPATLYRFESGQSEKMRPVTINRIAKVAKIEPPEFSGLSESDARIFDVADIPDFKLPTGENSQLIAVKVMNEAMAAADILPGDIIVISRAIEPQPGDIVCAQDYDFRLGAADTIIRYFEPPYLVAATSHPELRRPILVDGDKTVITGVALRRIRITYYKKVA